jgi:hypothetical protein
MAFASVQTLTDPAHDLALDEVQSIIGFVHHQDVLLAPTGFLERVKVGGLGLKFAQRATVVGLGNFHIHFLIAPRPGNQMSSATDALPECGVRVVDAATPHGAHESGRRFHRPHLPMPVG